MSDAEIESLVVRLTGDAEEYKRMLNEAATATQKTAAVVEQSSKRIESFGLRLRNYSGAIVTAITGLAIKHKVDQTFDAFSEAEAIEIKLTAALEANGRAVEQTMAQYKKFANQLQATTTLEDDYVLSLLKTAETYGITGKQAEQVVQQAVALGKATDNSAEAMIRITQAMSKGDIETARMFSRQVRQLRGVKNESEFLAKYQGLMATGWKVINREVETASGKITRLKVAWGNVLEEFGKFIAEGLKPIVDWLQKATEWFASLSQGTKKTIAIVAGLASAFLTLGPAISIVKMVLPLFAPLVGILTSVAALFSPIGLAIAGVVALVALWVDSVGGTEAAWNIAKDAVMGFWTEVKPIFQALMSFFTAIWEVVKELFGSLWDLAKEVFGGIQSVIKAVWDFIGEDTKAVFTFVRDFIRDAILFGEFVVRNFKAVVAHVWTGIKLSFSLGLDFIKNIFWGIVAVSKGAWDAVWEGAKALWDNVVEFFSGGGNFKNIGAIMANAFNEGFKKIAVGRMGPSEWTKELIEQFKKEAAALGISWEEFRKSKLQEFAEKHPEVVKEAEVAGSIIGQAFNKGIGKEVQAMDAVLSRSAEALSRVRAYQSVIEVKQKGLVGGGRAARNPDDVEMLAKLGKANEWLEKIANKEGVEFAPVGIA